MHVPEGVAEACFLLSHSEKDGAEVKEYARMIHAAGRRRKFGFGAAGWALLAFLVVSFTDARGEEAVPAEAVEEAYWVASLNVGFEFFAYEGYASVTNNVNGPLWNLATEGTSDQGLVQLGFDLVAPIQIPLPGRPRPFVGAGVSIPTATLNAVVEEGDPRNPTYPEQYAERYLANLDRLQNPRAGRPCYDNSQGEGGRGCPGPKDNEFDFVRGQGSAIDITIENPGWYAEIGTEFSFRLLDRASLEIRPALGYRGERLAVRGYMTTVVVDPDPFDPYSSIPPTLTTYRSVVQEQRLTQHYLGPSLELGVGFLQGGPGLNVSLYVEGSYFWLLNQREVTFTDEQGYATYTYAPNDGQFRGSVGFRIGLGL